MEPINHALNRVVRAPDFAARFNSIREEVMKDPKVQRFLTEHSTELSESVIEKSIHKIYEYSSASHQCDKCPNLSGCVNIMTGFEPKLALKRGFIEIDYVKCKQQQLEDDRRNVAEMVESMHMPKEVMAAQLHHIDLDHDDSRLEVVEAAKDFLREYDQTGKLPVKGLYIYGPFGIGKSYILGALTNELAKRRIKTVAVYVPEFLREMKQSIQDNTLNTKIDFVKRAPVLILDDFGAESMSAWARDEVFGTILQYRMAEQLPTFFTSNFSFVELENHLTFSQKNDKEPVKAARIMERIETISRSLQLTGENLRKK